MSPIESKIEPDFGFHTNAQTGFALSVPNHRKDRASFS